MPFKLIPLFFILNIFISHTAFSQADSNALPARKFADFEPGIRIGVGAEPGFYGEAAFETYRMFSRQKMIRSEAAYAGIKYMPSFEPLSLSIYGFKIGAETSYEQLGVGTELQLITDAHRYDFVITPKIGLTAFGIVSVFFGYNISTARYPFERVSTGQLSLAILLNRPKSKPL